MILPVAERPQARDAVDRFKANAADGDHLIWSAARTILIQSCTTAESLMLAPRSICNHSDRDVDAWINFNTISSSGTPAGVAKKGEWNANPACNI
jgi:hypothetical protein